MNWETERSWFDSVIMWKWQKHRTTTGEQTNHGHDCQQQTRYWYKHKVLLSPCFVCNDTSHSQQTLTSATFHLCKLYHAFFMLKSYQCHKKVYLERFLPTHPKRWIQFFGLHSIAFPANRELTFILRLEVLSQTCKNFLSCFLWMLKESLDPHSPDHELSFCPITYLPCSRFIYPHLSVTFQCLSSENSSPWSQPEQLGSFRAAGRSRMLRQLLEKWQTQDC